MEARLVVALAVLAACASSFAQPVVIPWVKLNRVLDTRQVACGTTVNFLWNGWHTLEQTVGKGCSAPEVKDYGTSAVGNVSIYYGYAGSYEYKCSYSDHCTEHKQMVEVQVGACAAGPNVLTWGFRRDAASYAPLVVPCGTAVTFAWNTTGRHDVVQVAKADCNSTVIETLAVPSPLGNATVTFTKRGSYHYLCAVTNHCTVGKMLTTVHVTGLCPGEKPVKKPVAHPPPRKVSRPPPHGARPPAFRGIVVKG